MVFWFAGIDWGDTAHHVVVIDTAGQVVAAFCVDHTAEGIEQLTTRLRHVLGDHDQASLACIVETTHGLLVTQLVDAAV